ncbi:MAG: patatin-like phospholipase family protein [Schleiferiaceae bacterium]|nr:patatin-like phospholipase family protein [Schleiferiaceae bacterium]
MKKSIGIALSGGGARGFAHLGMLEVLMDNQIIPDSISGTSIGAIVGALIADGKHPKEIFEIFENKAMLTFVRPAFSWKALLNLDGMQELLKKHLKSSTIEDLSMPTTLVATDLYTGSTKAFTTGNLLESLMASAAIPMVFDPILINGVLYADGGLTCNLPAGYVSGNIVVGLNLVPVPQVSKLNSPIKLADRTLAIAVNQNTIRDRGLCDILLEPEELYKYRFLDTGKAQKLYDIGKNEALKKLPELKTLIAE